MYKQDYWRTWLKGLRGFFFVGVFFATVSMAAFCTFLTLAITQHHSEAPWVLGYRGMSNDPKGGGSDLEPLGEYREEAVTLNPVGETGRGQWAGRMAGSFSPGR